MTKVASAYYSTAVAHKQVDGLYQATFGIPGLPPMWVTDTDGSPKIFRSQDGAVLAGFKVMVTKLNRTRQQQDFQVKGARVAKNTIKSWSSSEQRTNEPTVATVFGKK
jgi:hypothetical protein